MSKLISSFIACLMLLYPVAVYFGIQYFQPWKIALVLMLLLAVRLMTTSFDSRGNKIVLLLCIAYAALAIWNNNLITLRFYPILISLGLLSIFAISLRYPPTVIEKLARLQHPQLPEQGIIYTRKVTQVWCVFFIFNASVASYTAFFSSFECWSLYNGFISYLLMGLLMAGEYLVRIRTQAHVR